MEGDVLDIFQMTNELDLTVIGKVWFNLGYCSIYLSRRENKNVPYKIFYIQRQDETIFQNFLKFVQIIIYLY